MLSSLNLNNRILPRLNLPLDNYSKLFSSTLVEVKDTGNIKSFLYYKETLISINFDVKMEKKCQNELL